MPKTYSIRASSPSLSRSAAGSPENVVESGEPGDPSGSALTVATVDRFLQQQETLKGLLNDARQADLTNTTVPLSLARFIRLRLGDTLRFFIYHIERHVVQAEKVLTVG